MWKTNLLQSLHNWQYQIPCKSRFRDVLKFDISDSAIHQEQFSAPRGHHCFASSLLCTLLLDQLVQMTCSILGISSSKKCFLIARKIMEGVKTPQKELCTILQPEDNIGYYLWATWASWVCVLFAFPLGIFKPFFVVEHIITLVTLKSVITGKKYCLPKHTWSRYLLIFCSLVGCDVNRDCTSVCFNLLGGLAFFLLETVVSWYDEEAISHKSRFKHIWGDICRVLEP